MAKKEINVHGIANNGIGRENREPLVQVLGFNSECSDLSSFHFKPKFAKR